MNYATVTLGALLSAKDETIRRNAMAILKKLQDEDYEVVQDFVCCAMCASRNNGTGIKEL